MALHAQKCDDVVDSFCICEDGSLRKGVSTGVASALAWGVGNRGGDWWWCVQGGDWTGSGLTQLDDERQGSGLLSETVGEVFTEESFWNNKCPY